MMLLDVLVRSSLILLLGLLLMPLLRRQSAALRHMVLVTSLLCAAAMPLVTWLLPSWDVAEVAAVLPEPVRERAVSAAAASATLTRAIEPVAPSNADAPSRAWTDYVVPVWMIGAGASLLMLFVGIARLHRVDSSSEPIASGPWHAEAPLSATVRVTPHRGLLLVWGIRRPSIIVPAAALHWPLDRIRLVLQHELAHIRRRDWPVLMIAETVRAIYWFHPLVWLTCARLRAECEIACDDAVIAQGAAGTVYASHVIDVAQELNSRVWLPAPAIVRQSTLERRVRAMLNKSQNRRPVSSSARGAAIAVLVAITLTVAAVAAQSFVSLSGTIVDASNGVLPGVKTILVNNETQAKYEIQTNKSGRYEFVGLPPGSYTLEATLPGFTRFSARVAVGTQNVQQDLKMDIGMIQETITVREDAAAPAPDPERERRIAAIREKRAAAANAPRPSNGGERMGGNIAVPLKLRDFRPVYPASLSGTDGNVVLMAKITTSGAVGDIEVQSATHQEFAQSAIDAVSQWEFTATLLNGEPVATPMQVTVNFRVR